ncbi:hypothetical protein TNCV_2664671 [Trichonephila clavipes]|nr:hypothetical protein TNCV_2664671 [Trichonephila clavipes]
MQARPWPWDFEIIFIDYLEKGKTIIVRTNSWDAQLPIPNDPRYARLEANLRIGQAKEGQEQCRDSLVTPLPCEAKHCPVKK